jgi:hypothetical protein
LSDDSWYRGYVAGVLDALGVSVGEAIPLLQGRGLRPRRRIVEVRSTAPRPRRHQVHP